MAVKELNYVVTKDFKTPYVVSTGRPDKPTQLKFKHFKKGDIVKGELKMDNGQPAFVMVKKTILMPLEVIKQVVTKDVNMTSSAEGDTEKKIDIKKKPVTPKMRYIDAAIIGAIAGFGAMYYAEKREWITAPEGAAHQNKLLGIVIGASLGAYIVYRFKQPKSGVAVTVKEQ